jgi:tetratricopeptide (TPR) repeat protein/tRNA A-37 threonylcarbamoyl transferase component Bud32
MDPSALPGLGELLDAALAQPPDTRAEFARRACEGDSARLRHLLDLIETHDRAADWFDGLAADLAADADLEIDVAASRTSHIGPWRIVRLIGRGGMGSVFLVERADGQFEQQAALKLSRVGFDDEVAMARFLAERQIVARLDHPNIARLIDGGVAADGRPYFVMELVTGRPLMEYVRDCRLTIRERLELFIQLGEAVQYAHRHLVVHRDVKPSNVLVTDAGIPKLLDFGIAKLFDPEEGRADGTMTRDRAMTPVYAAPEQIDGRPVTTATDVYSMGVVLYELLSGRRPFEAADRSPRDLELDVLQRPADRPSAGMTDARERRQVAGDLDTICLMALRKEPERRYQSAQQLTDEVRRYLDGRPVLARPDTIAYRTAKFARRHAIGVSMSIAAIVLIVASAIALALQSARAARERDKAQQVAALLIDVFEVADPSEIRGAQVTAREVLDRGVERVERGLGSQPDVQADLRSVLGRVYRNLGLYERATGLTSRALDQIALLQGPRSATAAATRSRLGELLYLTGEYPRAEIELREALAVQEAADGPASADVAITLNHLGKTLQAQGRLDEAEAALRRALSIGERGGQSPVLVAEAVTNLGAVMFVRSRLNDAEPLFRRALTIRREQLGNDHPLVAASLSNLATLLSRKGDLDGAERTGREALDVARRVYGPQHPRVATVLNNLGLTEFARKNPAAAEPWLAESLAMRRQLLAPMHPELAQSLANLGLVVQTLQRPAEALPMYEEALAIRLKALGPEHVLVAQTLNNLGLLHQSLGDLATADEELRRSVAMLRKTAGESHPLVTQGLSNLAALACQRGRTADGVALYEDVLKRHRQASPPAAEIGDVERAIKTCR